MLGPLAVYQMDTGCSAHSPCTGWILALGPTRRVSDGYRLLGPLAVYQMDTECYQMDTGCYQIDTGAFPLGRETKHKDRDYDFIQLDLNFLTSSRVVFT
jgi:hypothetical protein